MQAMTADYKGYIITTDKSLMNTNDIHLKNHIGVRMFLLIFLKHRLIILFA